MLPYLIYKRSSSEPLARLRNHTKIKHIQMFENWGQDLVSEAENFCHLSDIFLLSKRKWNARPHRLHRFVMKCVCGLPKEQNYEVSDYACPNSRPSSQDDANQTLSGIWNSFEKVLTIQLVLLPFFWSWCHNKARRCKLTTTSWLNVGIFDVESLRKAGKLDNDIMNKSSPQPHTAMLVSRPLVHLNVFFPI